MDENVVLAVRPPTNTTFLIYVNEFVVLGGATSTSTTFLTPLVREDTAHTV
jgi:hypothetical protein